jgi:hypothetical protein
MEHGGFRHLFNVLQGTIELHLKHPSLLLQNDNILTLGAATLSGYSPREG